MRTARPLTADGPTGAAGATTSDDGPALAVALYSPGWPPSRFPNGVVSYTGAVAGGLRALGHRVRVLTTRSAEASGEEAGVPVLDLSGLAAGPAARLRVRLDELRGRSRPSARVDWIGRALRSAAGRLASGGGLQVLEMEESFGWAARAAGRVPVVVRLHGPWFLNGPNQGADPDDPDFGRRVRAEGRAIRAAAAVSSPSRYVLEQVRAHYGLVLEGAEVIPNPVPIAPEARRWRPEDAEPDHVLFVGRFDRTKGGDVMIDAFARLLRDRPGARLTFVGPDPGVEVDGRRWSLADYAAQRLGAEEAAARVRWLGPLPPAEIEPLRRRASVVAVSSRNENFPMTLVESLALGCPVAATRAGGAVEAFEDGEHGLSCAPGDPEDLSAKLAALLSDAAGAAAMGRRAASYCADRYAPEVVAARTVALYRRALSGPDPEGGRP